MVMDKNRNLEQYKRMLRAMAAFIVIICTIFTFFVVWKGYYNNIVIFPFYYKGHWMVMAVYAVFIVLFLYIYGGLQFGYLKCSSIILSQMIAVVCANLMAYLVIVLLAARFVTIIPILYMTVVDWIIIIILANVITYVFKKLFPPRRMVLLYEDYEPDTILAKVNCRNDRYELNVSKCINDLSTDDLRRLIKMYDAVLIYDIHSEKRNRILKLCYAESVRVYTTPKISDILIKGSENIHLFDSPLLLMRNNGLSFEQKAVKRTMDIVVSLVILIITLPITLVVALAIKMYDGGPVMFRQDRCTIDGKIFSIHKFRSMIVDAEKDGQVIPATDEDPRITPIGKLIRKTRIDELPQMIDILVGNMSVVGPRPERIEHVEAYTEEIPEFKYRLKVKGGLTGYAQIYGKYNTTPYDKLKLDLMYIQNYSLRLDIKLILMTIKIMFMKESTEGFKEESSKNRD